MKPNLRKKTTPVLLQNRRTLGHSIAVYHRQGRKADLARTEQILKETIEELKRRGVDA